MSSQPPLDRSLAGSEPPRLDHLRREFILNPITALAFYTLATNGRLYLLAGEDKYLRVYDVELSICCGQLTVFEAQSIHGIAVLLEDGVSGQVLVWGSDSVTVLDKNKIESVISGAPEDPVFHDPKRVARAPDWIFDGLLSPHESGRLVLLTAHNEIIEAILDQNRGSITLGKTTSPSRPNLYSGSLSWESRDEVLVAAGTVFGEIFVWRCSLSSSGDKPSAEILFIFSGHEGSIFGVKISPVIQLRNGESLRLLASCSDDRTIRVWNITDNIEVSKGLQQGYENMISAARETGFGDSVDVTEFDPHAARCVAVVMGHASRIWQVDFGTRQLITENGVSVEIWSFGEDATAQQWSLSLDNVSSPGIILGNSPTGAPTQIKHQATFSNHSGKQIWSHAMVNKSADELLIATGGADGKISLIWRNHHQEPKTNLSIVPQSSETMILEGQLATPSSKDSKPNGSHAESKTGDDQKDIAKRITDTTKPQKKPKPKKIKDESFQRYIFLAEDRLLAITSYGRVLLGSFAPDLQWKESSLPQEFRAALLSYSVIKGSSEGSLCFIGTASGDILIHRGPGQLTVKPLAKVHGKVEDMFYLAQEQAQNVQDGVSQDLDATSIGTQTRVIQLLVTVVGNSVATLLHISTSTVDTKVTERKITLPNGYIATSAALCNEYLILGSRNGRISIIEMAENGVYSPRPCSVEAVMKDAVTSITPLPRNTGDLPTCFLTTSRDGKYRIHSISPVGDSIEVALLHETSLPFGPLIEGAWFLSNADGSKDLILYGFRSKNFVVWNETQRQEITTVECGGAHRCFAYTPLKSHPDAFRFLYTKVSQLYEFAQTRAPHRALKSGGHGREIRAISFSGKYVATAAEDTRIRIWSCEGSQKVTGQTMHCLALMEKHTTGIQNLKWYKHNYLFSSGGNEEFFVWKVNQLRSDYTGLAVMCEAVFPDKSEVGDLRIIDFDVHCNDDTSDVNPLFCITMALSNSTLQTYAYSKQTGFRLLARASYTGACLTQLRHLHVDQATIQTLTAATDGYIAVWEADIEKSLKDVSAGSTEFTSKMITRVHQSTMKSLDLRQIDTDNGTSYLVVTGGDDNALGVTHVHNDRKSKEWTAKAKNTARSAHAAAVTGIAVLELECRGKEATVVSTSNDQRVKKWRLVDWWSRDMRVLLLDDQYSSVADSGDLEILDKGRFMVGGVGLEVWDVQG